MKVKVESTLDFHQVSPLLVGVWSLHLKNLVEGLALQTASYHGEVDKSDMATNVGGEFNRRITSGEEHGKCWREINVLIAQANEDMATCVTDLLVQNSVEDWIQMLHILNKNWVSKSQSALKNLQEGFIKEAGDYDLLTLVFIDQEGCHLASGVNDEGIVIEMIEYDGVLSVEIIQQEIFGLPAQVVVHC